jgi:hypothetical protein
MDQFQEERMEINSNRPHGSSKNCASKRQSVAIGLLTLAIIGATIAVVYMFENSESRSDEDSQILLDTGRPHKKKPKVTNARLPTTLQPLEYKLNLIPYLDPAKNFSIDGTVAIDLLCKEATDRVTVNIKNITIKEPTVTVVSLEDDEKGDATITNGSVAIRAHEYDMDRNFYIVILQEILVPGSKYRIYIQYLALLSDELVGFYRSSYVDKATNETRYFYL